MKTYFPDQADQVALDEYMAAVLDASSQARSFFAEKVVPDLVAMP